MIQKFEAIIVLLERLVEKTEHTNNLLSRGLKTQWGHGMATLGMDSDRFEKSEALRQKTKSP